MRRRTPSRFAMLGRASALVLGMTVIVAIAGPPALAGKPPPPPPPGPPPAAAVSWSPSTAGTFDYGTVAVGQSVTQEFTLTNSAGSSMGPFVIALSGSTAFTKTSDRCNKALGPGKSCTVKVRYTPTTGAGDVGTLTATGQNQNTASATLGLKGNSVSGRQIWWANSLAATVARANVDGTNQNQRLIQGVAVPAGIAIDSNFIYWPNQESIGRANLDGTGANQNFIPVPSGYPVQVEVNSTHIFWANALSDTIGRANLDGTGVNHSFIAASQPADVAVDATHIYWANYGPIGSIGRANLDSTGINQSFITGGPDGPLSGPDGVAVDSTSVYITEFGTKIRKAPKGTGGNSAVVIIQNPPSTGGTRGPAIDVASGKIYWAACAGLTNIGRANLDGSGAETFVTGANNPCAVAVNATHVYWASSTGGSSIGRALKDGTNVNQFFITGPVNTPAGVAADSSYVYWANAILNTIGRANRDGSGTNANFITGASFPVGVAVDSTYIYWTNIGTNTIGRALKADGSGANQSFIPSGPTINGPVGIAVDSGHIYWANFYCCAGISRADLNGQNAAQFICSAVQPDPGGCTLEGSFSPSFVAVDSSRIYWTDSHNIGFTRIRQVGWADLLNTANFDRDLVSDSVTPFAVLTGVAVDSTYLYWANPGTDTIGRINLDGTNKNASFITITAFSAAPQGVAVDPG